jgi:hypothetical protein
LLVLFLSVFLCFSALPWLGCSDKEDPKILIPPALSPSDKMYNWLQSMQNSTTGLVQSYSNTVDIALLDHAFTYDQALAGLCFVKEADYVSAAKILDFYNNKWTGTGFANSYDINNGGVRESIIHTGPNLWIALLALQYV